jgi:hypothetical protein
VIEDPKFTSPPPQFIAELSLAHLTKEVKWFLPIIGSPINAKIRKMDIKYATIMRGSSFDDISQEISKPYWLSITSTAPYTLQVV